MTESDTPLTESVLDFLASWEADANAEVGEVELDRLASVPTVLDSTRVEEWRDLAPTIIDLVAEQEGIDPWDLDHQLGTVINVDALECLFIHPIGEDAADGVVSFAFHGYTVKVASDGIVSLHERGD